MGPEGMRMGDFIRLVGNQRTGSFGPSPYKCFGPTTSMIYLKDGRDDVVAGITYNPHSGQQPVFCNQIFELVAIHRPIGRAMRWINPDYREKYLQESVELKIDPTQFEGIPYEEIEDYDDFLNRAYRLIRM